MDKSTNKDRDSRKRQAVGLHYTGERETAPRVVAKGKGVVAQKIIEAAAEAGVPIYEDPALVEVLSSVDLSSEIPPELYRVVAEVLAFIYRADKRMPDISG